MKKLLISLALAIFAFGINAQKAQENPEVRKTTDEQVQLYDLNEEQAAEMYIIQARKYRNFQQIQQYKETNTTLYNQKRQSIHEGTILSIKKMLTREQLEIQQQQRLAQRERDAAKIEELKATGATPAEIQTAVLDLQDIE